MKQKPCKQQHPTLRSPLKLPVIPCWGHHSCFCMGLVNPVVPSLKQEYSSQQWILHSCLPSQESCCHPAIVTGLVMRLLTLRQRAHQKNKWTGPPLSWSKNYHQTQATEQEDKRAPIHQGWPPSTRWSDWNRELCFSLRTGQNCLNYLLYSTLHRISALYVTRKGNLAWWQPSGLGALWQSEGLTAHGYLHHRDWNFHLIKEMKEKIPYPPAP